MDTQVSKKSPESLSQKRMCSSCHKEFENITNGLCEDCTTSHETIENDRNMKYDALNRSRRKYDKTKKDNHEKLVSPNENNPLYDIIEEFKLLLSIRGNNYAESLIHEHKLVSLCKNIFNSECSAHIFFYFCKYGAATAQVLQVQLSMNYQSVYRVIKKFSNLGFILPVRKIKKYTRSKGGPRYEVWAMLGVIDADVAECIKLHRRCISPKYRLAEEIIPTILDEYIYKRNVKEVTRRELIQYVKAAKLVSFNANDIVELAIPIIESKGIKVWR